MSSAAYGGGTWARLRDGGRIQLRVIGALMLRELHTRFGRENVGYLWLILEPMILALGVASFHLFTHVSLPYDFDPGSFYASGYITYIVFRNNVSRAPAMIMSNKPLLYHRNVTLQDISLSRSFLEAVATLGAMIVVLSLFIFTGTAKAPERPEMILLAIGLMSWLSAAFSMLITALCEFMPLLERFVHPTLYILLPVSGVFSVMDELPKPFAEASSWLVLAQILDIAREGLRTDFHSTYVNYPYILVVCSVMTFLGLLGLRAVRSRIHFE